MTGVDLAADMNAVLISTEALSRNAVGQWQYVDALGCVHVNVHAVRVFPISCPDGPVSIVGADGHELRWIDVLAALPAPLQQSIASMLLQRDFMPEIMQLKAVSTFATPSEWTVVTSIGDTTFTLKGEEDIRRLTAGVLLITDVHGIQYVIKRLAALDKHSRRLLDRFL
jgi:Domain of unknown function (DUF1854)